MPLFNPSTASSFPTSLTISTGQISTAADTTPVDVTNCVFSYAANSTYYVEVMGRFTTTGSTQGVGLAFNLSSAVTAISFHYVTPGTAAGATQLGWSSADDTFDDTTAGSRLVSGGTYPITGFGVLVTTSNTGTAQLRLRSETGSVVTLEVGAILRVHKIA